MRARSDRKSPEVFLREVEAVCQGRYTTSGIKYVNKRTKVAVTCTKCLKTWSTRPDTLLNGSGCPLCRRKTTKEFIHELHEKYPGVFTTDEVEYKSYQGKVNIGCATCSHKWRNTPANLLSYGRRCKYCYGSGLKTTAMFIADLIARHPDHRIDLTDINYVRGDIKMEVGCLDCSHRWRVIPQKLYSGRGCPKCGSSRGEKRVAKWLDSHSIPYKSEHKFNDCKDKRKLPFDFYLPAHNIAIEYDGIQHFSNDGQGKNGIRWGTHDLEGVRRRDAIKTNYCRNRGIKLIRIPYTSFNNIENILKKEVTNAKVQ